MKKRVIRVGSRESKLAVIQAELVMEKIREHHPEIRLQLITMKTTGDIILDRTLDKVGGKGLFVKELDRALMDKRIDIAVHSLKDLPTEISDELPLVAFTKREAGEDVLVMPKGIAVEEMDGSKPIGSSSPRRNLQIKSMYPHMEQKSIRGNVLTRLKKLDRGEYACLVLAKAGLERLGLEERISKVFTPEEMIPAAGQGIIAVQGREGEDVSYLDCVNNWEAEICAKAERHFIAYLEGGCSSPIGAYGEISGDKILLRGFYGYDDGISFGIDKAQGCLNEGRKLALALAQKMKAAAADTEAALTDGQGKVWLVGGGPGDPGLITVKGKQVIEEAQVIVYDSLVGDGILSMMPQNAKKINVGKRAGNHSVPQDQINEILTAEAKKGLRVVRLKGGDPFLFGRGGEELESLVREKIPYEIVPGVTSAIAVPAYNGIPVTHRDYTSSLHIITGHTKNMEREDIDFKALSRLGGTLVFLMGVSQLQRICEGLIAGGMDANTEAAVLESGTTAAQRSVVATVSTLAEDAKKAKIKTPAIIVVGKVCALGKWFAWAEKRELSGLKVAVTRPKDRASSLAKRLADGGAEVIIMPTITTEAIKTSDEMKGIMKSLHDYKWIGFTSVEGVKAFFDKLIEVGKDVRSLQGISFAVIGKATGRELKKRGILPDLMPPEYSGRALGRALGRAIGPGEKILLPRSKIGKDEILRPLNEGDVSYTDMPIYETKQIKRSIDFDLGSLDYVAFTSVSTVEAFATYAEGTNVSGIKALCIGEQTAKAASGLGMEVEMAEEATVDSMVKKLKCVRRK